MQNQTRNVVVKQQLQSLVFANQLQSNTKLFQRKKTLLFQTKKIKTQIYPMKKEIQSVLQVGFFIVQLIQTAQNDA